MSLQQHAAVLRASAWLIILSLVLAVVASLAVTVIVPPSYEARATLSVGQPLTSENIEYSDLLASQLLAKTYARLATTGPLLDATITRAKLKTDAEELRKRVRTEVQPDDTLIDLVVRDPNAGRAAEIANALAAELLGRTPQTTPRDTRSIDERIAALDALMATIEQEIESLSSVPSPTEAQVSQLDALTRRLDALAAIRGSLQSQLLQGSPGKLSLVDPAVAPNSAAGPGRIVVVLLSALVSLIVAVGLAYAISAWRAERDSDAPDRRGRPGA